MARTKRNKPGGERRYHERKAFEAELGADPRPGDNAAELASINTLKKGIRDVERLLATVTELPADQTIAKERELQSLKHDLSQAQFKKKKAKMISQYHHIRFYERQKAERHLKRATRALEDKKGTTDPDDLLHRVHLAQVDLNYTLYHPLLVPYSSLYAKKDQSEDESGAPDATVESSRRQNPMWIRVEIATSGGKAALKSLRNENSEFQQPASSRLPVRETKTGSKRRGAGNDSRASVTKSSRSEEKEDESDDNFFE